MIEKEKLIEFIRTYFLDYDYGYIDICKPNQIHQDDIKGLKIRVDAALKESYGE